MKLKILSITIFFFFFVLEDNCISFDLIELLIPYYCYDIRDTGKINNKKKVKKHIYDLNSANQKSFNSQIKRE